MILVPAVQAKNTRSAMAGNKKEPSKTIQYILNVREASVQHRCFFDARKTVE